MDNLEPLHEKYQHLKDVRTQNQKYLSDNIVRILSELNLTRIRTTQLLQKDLHHKYVFLCLTGMPAMDKEYENLQLPGEKIIYSTRGLNINISTEQFQQIYKNTNFESQALNLTQIINKIPITTKLIIIFHSFGTYILNCYRVRYGDERIFGLIDIAGLPVTWAPKIIPSFQKAQSISKYKELDFQYCHQKFLEASKLRNYVHLKNKHHSSLYLKMLREKDVENLYVNIRNYPDILKLFFIGRKDKFLDETFMNQKAIHYNYAKKLSQNYESKLRKAYKKLYGVEVKNIQERFVISFEDGQHSVHMQRRLVPDINLSINQYIKLLDQASVIDYLSS